MYITTVKVYGSVVTVVSVDGQLYVATLNNRERGAYKVVAAGAGAAAPGAPAPLEVHRAVTQYLRKR